MKLNSTYYSRDTKKLVVQKLSYLNRKLEEEIVKNFELLKVSSPIFFERNSNLLFHNNVSRNISFDSGSRGSINSLSTDNSLWFSKILKDYEIKKNEGIYTIDKSILRDLEEDPSQTIVKDELIIEIVTTDNEYEIENVIRKLTKQVFKIITNISLLLVKKFGSSTLYIDPYIEYTTSQMLENAYPDLNFIEREKSFLVDKTSFVMENPGQKLFSNKYHYNENPLLFDLKKQSLIIINNKVNNFPIKVAKISRRARGKVLSNQLKNFLNKNYNDNKFISRLIGDEYPSSIQIRIDRLSLALVLLDKGHIKELLPFFGEYSDETKFDIKRRIVTL